MAKVQKSDKQWREHLSDEEYRVLRQKGTEAPFTGAYVHKKDHGTYTCKACGAELFASDVKFDSNSGWPSFYDALPGRVEFSEDTTHGTIRTEVTCAICGSHLGHIFDDAVDQPSGKRYCINSVCLDFTPTDTPR